MYVCACLCEPMCVHVCYECNMPMCCAQMRKRKFSGLEVILIVMFLLVFLVAVVLIVLMATGENGVIKDEGERQWLEYQ